MQLERSVYGYERGYALRVYELGEVVGTGAGPLPLIAQSLREPDLLFSYRGELFFADSRSSSLLVRASPASLVLTRVYAGLLIAPVLSWRIFDVQTFFGHVLCLRWHYLARFRHAEVDADSELLYRPSSAAGTRKAP